MVTLVQGKRKANPQRTSSSAAERAAEAVRKRLPGIPPLAWVLGSGFHGAPRRLDVELDVPYASIPAFPQPSVPGHQGRLLVGKMGGLRVVVLCGRIHFYEGRGMEAVTFGVRFLAALGAKALVLTNAAGGINRSFRPGDFMVVADHINLMGANPLTGEPVPGLQRFVDLSRAYDPELTRDLLKSAVRAGARVHRGVYLAVSGPSYETPAEIRAFSTLGADAVGMSTVPEVIVARQCGLRVAAVSCITNMAAGRSPEPLSHEEVLSTGKRVEKIAAAMFAEFCHTYAEKD